MGEDIRKIKDSGRFYVDNTLIDDYGAILGANAVAVYVNLCRRAGFNQDCFPSQKRIADDLGISEPTVIRWLSVLEYFRIIRKIRVGKRCNNRYELIDREHWRKDFEVILNELSSDDNKSFNLKTKTILAQNLNRFISNIKVKPLKVIKLKNGFPQKNSEKESEGYDELKGLKEELKANNGFIIN